MLKPKVLIIDDDSTYLALLQEALEVDFSVVCAKNLSEVSDIAASCETQAFDIALVDENIGQEKGSQWIKQQVQGTTLAKSFVLYSGLATEEAILKGLECGADDFLAKPISLLTLIKKLKRLIDYQNKINIFESELSSKDHVINVSMAQASKYGSCMLLISKLNQCFSLEKIRDEIFSYLNSMNLEGCIGFYDINEASSFYNSKKGICSPVEIDVMKLLKIKPRLFRFGPRTIFNHELVSILILNLEDGTIDTDIYIDALASVIECAGARIAFIGYQKFLVGVQDKIQQAVTQTQKMIAISKHQQQEVMNEIVTNIGQSFHILDMSFEQEEYLTDLVHNALKKHSQDDLNFLEVSRLLDSTLKSVDELKSLNSNQVEDVEERDQEDELF